MLLVSSIRHLYEFYKDLFSQSSILLYLHRVQDRHNENQVNNGNYHDENPIDRDPSDNTDICYVDLEKSKRSNHVKGSAAIFHDDFDLADSPTEGPAHCHGFAWKDSNQSPSKRYRGNNLFYISMCDHLHQRGYVRNVPGAAMCSCVDDAPVVSQSELYRNGCDGEVHLHLQCWCKEANGQHYRCANHFQCLHRNQQKQ